MRGAVLASYVALLCDLTLVGRRKSHHNSGFAPGFFVHGIWLNVFWIFCLVSRVGRTWGGQRFPSAVASATFDPAVVSHVAGRGSNWCHFAGCQCRNHLYFGGPKTSRPLGKKVHGLSLISQVWLVGPSLCGFSDRQVG